MTDSERLLRDIVRAAKKFKWTPGYLGVKAVNNGHLPIRLAAGRPVSLETAAKLRAFIAAEIERRAYMTKRTTKYDDWDRHTLIATLLDRDDLIHSLQRRTLDDFVRELIEVAIIARDH